MVLHVGDQCAELAFTDKLLAGLRNPPGQGGGRGSRVAKFLVLQEDSSGVGRWRDTQAGAASERGVGAVGQAQVPYLATMSSVCGTIPRCLYLISSWA